MFRLMACVLVTQVVIVLFCVVLFRAPTALLYGLSALVGTSNGIYTWQWGLAAMTASANTAPLRACGPGANATAAGRRQTERAGC